MKAPIREFSKRNNTKHPSWKKSYVAPVESNQDLVVFPNRGIHPLSGYFKNFDVKWLSVEIKGDHNLVFGINMEGQYSAFFCLTFYVIFWVLPSLHVVMPINAVFNHP